MMLKNHFLFFITFLIHTILNGQKVWFVTGYDQHFNSDASSIRSMDLFDTVEIKARGIKRACLFSCSGERDENGSFNQRDTTHVFLFDSSGQTTHRINYQKIRINGSLFKDTSYLQKNDNKLKDSTISKVELSTTGSTITDLIYLQFEYGMDTAFIVTKKYDGAGQLMEEKKRLTKAFIKAVDCISGEQYHFQYKYDDNKRLVFYRDFQSGEYKIFSYPFFGRITQTYNVKTITLIAKEVTLIQNEPDFISETNIKESITITRHAKNSKLFHRFSITNLGEPSYTVFYEIAYY